MGVAGFECRSHSMYPEVKRMIIKEKYFLKDNLIYCTILSTFCTVFFVCLFVFQNKKLGEKSNLKSFISGVSKLWPTGCFYCHIGKQPRSLV